MRNKGKVAVGTLVFAVVIGLAMSGNLYAGEGHPSSKVTAKCGDIIVATPNDTWTTVLENTIKCANKKDLFIDVSMVSQLVTQTRVKSKRGVEDTSVAGAGVEVRVVLDEGTPAEADALPGSVVFEKRIQTLSATFQGLIEECIDVNGHIDINDTCIEPEEVELILDTMSANSFNFIAIDVSSGVHSVAVQVRPSAAVTKQDGSASANVIVGPGSVTIEEVRLRKDEDVPTL